MSFTINYTLAGENKSANETNEDFKLITTEKKNRFTVTIHTKKDICLQSFNEVVPFIVNEGDLYFFNGYQSWTDTKEFKRGEKQRDLNKLPSLIVKAFALDSYGDASFCTYGKGLAHGFDIFYCKGKYEKYILNLNYTRAYLLIELDKKKTQLRLSYDFNGLKVAAGTKFTVADYYDANSVKEGVEFFEATFPRKNIPKIFGYTSWYNYYKKIDESIILRDLEALDEKFNLFQIDDGYETRVGDWLSVNKKKFPNGLEPIVDEIHKRGFKAGIWLAPFVAEEKSQLFLKKKYLFKRNKKGDFIKCGSNWGGFYALDLDNPHALEYIEQSLKHYADMGFDFFKLDFLYAANLYVSEGTSRSIAAEKAYAFLRKCLGDKIILGCGATVFNCIDKFDYLRVGPDVSLKFDDSWIMRHMHRERISTKVTLQNTIYRSFFNDRFFGNDPDVFLLRDDNIKLSAKQRKALLTVNALFGKVLMTSDNIGQYNEGKRKLLSDALDLFYNAQVTQFTRKGNKIEITYMKDDIPHTVKYDTNRGTLS